MCRVRSLHNFSYRLIQFIQKILVEIEIYSFLSLGLPIFLMFGYGFHFMISCQILHCCVLEDQINLCKVALQSSSSLDLCPYPIQKNERKFCIFTQIPYSFSLKIVPFTHWQSVELYSFELSIETEGYSGADLKYLVRYIILHSLHFEEESDTVKKVSSFEMVSLIRLLYQEMESKRLFSI